MPEIQQITLNSGEPEHEVQVVETTALPEANEVQSVATRAWGWQYEVQQLDVQVSVKPEEREIQSISTGLKHAREVQSIVVTAASNTSEVQRVKVSAHSALSGFFALEYGFYTTANLHVNASEADVVAALTALPILGEVVDAQENISPKREWLHVGYYIFGHW